MKFIKIKYVHVGHCAEYESSHKHSSKEQRLRRGSFEMIPTHKVVLQDISIIVLKWSPHTRLCCKKCKLLFLKWTPHTRLCCNKYTWLFYFSKFSQSEFFGNIKYILWNLEGAYYVWNILLLGYGLFFVKNNLWETWTGKYCNMDKNIDWMYARCVF